MNRIGLLLGSDGRRSGTVEGVFFVALTGMVGNDVGPAELAGEFTVAGGRYVAWIVDDDVE